MLNNSMTVSSAYRAVNWRLRGVHDLVVTYITCAMQSADVAGNDVGAFFCFFGVNGKATCSARQEHATTGAIAMNLAQVLIRGRTAISDLQGAERHHFEGGLRHVPALAGSAH